jgi:hypothetical protein
MNLSAIGIGKILAILGLVLTIVLIVIAKLALFPLGFLFALAFLAMLL